MSKWIFQLVIVMYKSLFAVTKTLQRTRLDSLGEGVSRGKAQRAVSKSAQC